MTPLFRSLRRIRSNAIPALMALALIAPAVSWADAPVPTRIDPILTRARERGINPDDLVRLCDEARRRGLTDADGLALADAVLRMAEENLPHRPVYDRILQGLAKNVPPDRINAVVLGMERKLRVGAALVDGSLAEATSLRTAGPADAGARSRLSLIDQTTFAIEKGVPETSIAAVFAELKVSSATPADVLHALQSPVVALTSLASEGVPPEQGLRLVTQAFRDGWRGQNLEMLAMAVAHAPPGDRDRVARYVREQLRQGKPPEEILRDMRRRARDGDRRHEEFRDRRRDGRQAPGGDARPPDDPGRRRGNGDRNGTGSGTGGHP